MQLIDFAQHVSNDTVTTLQVLLQQAQLGNVTGMIYACEYTDRHVPVVGYTGRWRRNEFAAIGVASYMLRELHMLAEQHRAVT